MNLISYQSIFLGARQNPALWDPAITMLPCGGNMECNNMKKCNAGAENSGGKEVAVKEASKKHRGQHDYTHNFWLGCHKVSEGCKNCYMFVAQNRRRSWGWNTPDPKVVMLVKGAFKTPLPVQRKAARARREERNYKSVFACSYSDFFLPEADAWRDAAWALIRQTPNLIWQISTKRPELIADRLPADWGNGYPNVWLGTSVELEKYLWRLDALRKIPCVLRWADFAPHAGRLDAGTLRAHRRYRLGMRRGTRDRL